MILWFDETKIEPFHLVETRQHWLPGQNPSWWNDDVFFFLSFFFPICPEGTIVCVWFLYSFLPHGISGHFTSPLSQLACFFSKPNHMDQSTEMILRKNLLKLNIWTQIHLLNSQVTSGWIWESFWEWTNRRLDWNLMECWQKLENSSTMMFLILPDSIGEVQQRGTGEDRQIQGCQVSTKPKRIWGTYTKVPNIGFWTEWYFTFFYICYFFLSHFLKLSLEDLFLKIALTKRKGEQV